MLESTEAKVYFVHYTPELEHARSRGELRVNSFARLHNLSGDGAALMDVQDLGDAESLLSNRSYFTNATSNLLNRGIMPTEDGWGGWLGRYHAALTKTAIEMTQARTHPVLRNYELTRQRDRSLGR